MSVLGATRSFATTRGRTSTTVSISTSHKVGHSGNTGSIKVYSEFSTRPRRVVATQAEPRREAEAALVEPQEIRVSGILVLENVNSPIRVGVEYTPEHVTVLDPSTGIFGVGSSFKEAVEDFHVALREHFEVLQAQPALSEPLQIQLSVLQSYLR